MYLRKQKEYTNKLKMCQFLIGNVSLAKKELDILAKKCQFLIGNVSQMSLKKYRETVCVNSS